jgi:two-component system, OmpR family, response regulator CpxR
MPSGLLYIITQPRFSRDLSLDRILIIDIDDDIEMCTMLEEYLESEGLDTEVEHEGTAGLKRADQHDLIALDVMLPGINGLELLRQLRSESAARVVLLSARGEEVDRIVGLEIGADDYVSKPFSPRELLARILAILRRTDPQGKRTVPRTAPILISDIEMDFGTRTVPRNGKPITLTAVEFNLLELLLRSAGRVVTREQVAELVLGRNLNSFDRSIDVHVSKLRRKLGNLPSGEKRIRSIRSRRPTCTCALPLVSKWTDAHACRQSRTRNDCNRFFIESCDAVFYPYFPKW